MAIQKHVGKKIARLRRQKGISQEELGFDSGFHRTYISQVERGVTNPTIGSLKQIANALSVPCWKLVEPH
ncbi:MAG: helix-turn-helix domain-containing protein [Sphingomonadales bacterium]|nr:helix-turn-helix domain-containing protein [Sphingomonadales bacterium]